jgi:hypothetical protein
MMVMKMTTISVAMDSLTMPFRGVGGVVVVAMWWLHPSSSSSCHGRRFRADLIGLALGSVNQFLNSKINCQSTCGTISLPRNMQAYIVENARRKKSFLNSVSEKKKGKSF